MKLFSLFLLFTGCLATPIQQGSQINADGSYSFFFDNNQREGRQFRDETRNSDGTIVGKFGYQDPSGALRIVKYTAGNSGIIANGDGMQVGPTGQGQPLVWDGRQPIIVDAAPLVYANAQQLQGVKGVQFLAPNEQQRHMSTEEEVEAREEAGVEEEPKAETEPKDESEDTDNSDNSDTSGDSNSNVEPKAQDNNQSNNDNPSPVPAVKPKKQDNNQQNDQVGDRDQTFPQVQSGNRRLVESKQQQQQQQQQQSGVKGKSLLQTSVHTSPVAKQRVIYQSVQHGIPITIQEQRIQPLAPVSQVVHNVQNQVVGGVKRPVIQLSQPNVLRQLVNRVNQRPVQVLQAGVLQPVINSQGQIQYVLQPVYQQGLGVEQRQLVLQPEVQQVLGLDQRNVQILSGIQQQGVNVDQGPVLDQRYLSVQDLVQQTGNVDQRSDVEQRLVGVSNVPQNQVQQSHVVLDQRQVKPGNVQVGVVTDQVQQVPQGHVVVDQRQLQPGNVQVGVLTEQIHVPVIQGNVQQVGNLDHRVVQQGLNIGSGVTQRVNPIIGYQYIIPSERRQSVSDEQLVVQPRGENVVHLSNQPIVLNPHVSQPLTQNQEQYISEILSNRDVIQQQPMSELQAYYQSIRESPVSPIGQINNQYVTQLGQIPSIYPIGYTSGQSVPQTVRRQHVIQQQHKVNVKPLVLVNRNVGQRAVSGTKTIVPVNV